VVIPPGIRPGRHRLGGRTRQFLEIPARRRRERPPSRSSTCPRRLRRSA